MVHPKSSNVYWHPGQINRNDRESLKGHRGLTLWFTGIPASGKSTLAVALEKELYERNCHTYILDGDNIRHGLNKNLGFSPEDRKENIRRIGEVAALLRDCGIINLVAFISPYRSDRQAARALSHDDGTFLEVFVDCPVEVCEERDPKGMYKKAREGLIKEFTAVSAPYEPPEDPEIHLHTGRYAVNECVQLTIDYLLRHDLISPKLPIVADTVFKEQRSPPGAMA
ncbi:MAG: adenylyl-sulfate kinase [Desulfobacterales bacterium]|nr:MAG: adenylyl-sulfate kinase [Desulfobacterales bacterium]